MKILFCFYTLIVFAIPALTYFGFTAGDVVNILTASVVFVGWFFCFFLHWMKTLKNLFT